MGLAFNVFLALILSILCWLIGSIYIKALYKQFAPKINNSKDSEEAVKYRKRYCFLVSFEKLFYAIIALVGCILICEVSDYIGEMDIKVNEQYFSSLMYWFFFAICMGFYVILMTKNVRYSPITNLSHIRTKNQKMSKPYVLFLRGFGTDIYSVSYQERRKGREIFSEHNFVKRLSLLYNVYAVGRPEELLSPSGAARVYLDNATWQQDVQSLMKEAFAVVILVSDKKNCVWEIEQSSEMQSKTIYIVNNRDKYDKVKHLLPTPITNTISKDCKHFVIWRDNAGQTKWLPFTNRGNSYWNIIRIIEEIANNNTKTKNAQNSTKTGHSSVCDILMFSSPIFSLGIGIWIGFIYESFLIGLALFILLGWFLFFAFFALYLKLDNSTESGYTKFVFAVSLLSVVIGIGILSGIYFSWWKGLLIGTLLFLFDFAYVIWNTPQKK